jgi:hypothetical protein
MANKNYAGTMYVRTKAKETRLVERIDKRNDNGDNMENVDRVWQNHSTNEEGARVWSF